MNAWPDVQIKIEPRPHLIFPGKENARKWWAVKELFRHSAEWVLREDALGFAECRLLFERVPFVATQLFCARCNESWPHFFMLTKEAWAQTRGGKSLLCFTCCEDLLERRITRDDLTDCWWNRLLKHVMRGEK